MKKLVPTTLQGKITPPSSKAISHRALLFAAVGQSGSEVHNILRSEDVRATRESLERMGAIFEPIEHGFRLEKGIYQGSQLLNCLNSGTTLRLLTSIAALFPETTMLLGDDSLNQRPMGPLIDALNQLGADIESENGNPPIKIKSPIKNYQTSTEIRGDVSSQYISSLLIMASVRGELIETSINLIPPIVSKPYIELTIQMLRERNVKIDENEAGYTVTGEIDLGTVDISVPSDFSSAAFYIVAGALPGNRIEINNISFQYPQADSAILDIVEKAGATVIREDTRVIIEGDELTAIQADLSQSPDIFPILCVLAANASGTSKLYNAKHLRLKETDRIATMLHNLRQVGIEVEELEDGAKITGGTIQGDCELDSYHDHRIAMAAAILSTRAMNPLILKNADCVDVSYPDFYQHLEELSNR